MESVRGLIGKVKKLEEDGWSWREAGMGAQRLSQIVEEPIKGTSGAQDEVGGPQLHQTKAAEDVPVAVKVFTRIRVAAQSMKTRVGGGETGELEGDSTVRSGKKLHVSEYRPRRSNQPGDKVETETGRCDNLEYRAAEWWTSKP